MKRLTQKSGVESFQRHALLRQSAGDAGFEMKGRELVPDAVVRLFVIRFAGILRHAFKRAGERPRGVREKLDEVILVERIRTWDRRPDVLLENASEASG